jgi:predicted AAA+ superfamily ATPase
MTRREQLGLGAGGAWDELLDAKPQEWPDVLRAQSAPEESWKALAARGGFPTPALELRTAADRALWFDGYARTYLERDLQDLASIASLPDFRRFMRAVCLRLGQLVNQAEIGRDVSVPQPTVHRWMNLLETSCLLVRLPAYAVNRTKRLIKAPKAYWADTGLAMHLAQLEEPAGAHLENLVLHDLLAWRETRSETVELAYWRTASGAEVDLVVEVGSRLLPIEVKATAHPRLGDAAHLRAFRAEYGKRALPGLLLHTGPAIEWLGPDVLAAPWWKVM